MPGQLLSYLQSRYPRQRTRMNRQHTNSSIQVIRRHQQLQTQLWRDLHIRHIGLVLVLVVVAEILADFLQDDSTEGLEHTAAGDCFGEVAFSPSKRSQCVAIRRRREGCQGRTRWLQHAAYCPRNAGGVAWDDEFEAVARDESHVFCW